MRKAGRPPSCRKTGRMSGVLVKKFARKYSLAGYAVSSVRYSINSDFVLRQVKYVYDWVNPDFAKARIILGRVNASDRKIASGQRAFTSRISHSQKGNGLVWGLSTRKGRTPPPTQNRIVSRNSVHNPSRSGLSKSTLTMSSYFFGGFSAYLIVPSGRKRNHCGCSRTQGWSGAVWIAKSSATSIPSAAAARTKRRKSARVPSSGLTAR